MTLRKIDPMNIVENDDALLLEALLAQLAAHKEFIIQPGKIYLIRQSSMNLEVEVELNKLVLLYNKSTSSDSDAERIGYMVADTEPFKGNNGLFEVKGKLIKNPDGSGMVFRPEQEKHLIKRQLLHAGVDITGRIDNDQLKEEQAKLAIAKLAPHLKIKGDTIVVNEEEGIAYSFYLLDYFKGKPLSKFIEQNKYNEKVESNKKIEITDQQLLQLVPKLLSSLYKQIHSYHIIHRDVKPDNIIIDYTALPVTDQLEKIESIHTIQIIDLDTAKMKGEKPLTIEVGTPAYSSPELLLDSKTSLLAVDEKSDVFSMGLIIREMLGEEQRGKEYASVEDLHYILRDAAEKGDTQIKWNEEQPFKFLKHTGSGLKDTIKATLDGMLTPEPENRLSLEQALKKFHQIKMQFELHQLRHQLLEETNTEANINLEVSNDKVDKVNANLINPPQSSFFKGGSHNENSLSNIDSEMNKQLMERKIGMESGLHAFEELTKLQRNHTTVNLTSLREVEATIINEVQKIYADLVAPNDASLALSEFTEVANLDSLKGLDSLHTIKNKMNEIIFTMQDSKNQLQQLKADLKDLIKFINKNKENKNLASIRMLNLLIEDIERLNRKIKKCPNDLDQVASLNERMTKEIAATTLKIKEVLTDISHHVVSQDIKNYASLLPKLTLENDRDEATLLSNNIKRVIRNYLNTEKKRFEEINDILDILETKNPNMEAEILQKLKNFKTGFLGGSVLREGIYEVLKDSRKEKVSVTPSKLSSSLFNTLKSKPEKTATNDKIISEEDIRIHHKNK